MTPEEIQASPETIRAYEAGYRDGMGQVAAAELKNLRAENESLRIHWVQARRDWETVCAQLSLMPIRMS